MEKNCALCGKKIGLMNGHIQNNSSTVVFCDKCNETAVALKHYAKYNKEKYREAHTYFENYINSNKYPDQVIDVIKNYFIEAEQLRQKANELELHKELANKMMMTSGYNFEGYRIVKYIDIISSEVVLGTGLASNLNAKFADISGGESDAYTAKLDLAREKANEKLRKEAVTRNGNAIIGIHIDYVIFSNDLIGVMISGTAVEIKVINE